MKPTLRLLTAGLLLSGAAMLLHALPAPLIAQSHAAEPAPATPIAASGARMITTLIYELRRRGGGIGVAAMCAGGGQGGAVVIEV